jgi:uncharacterized phage protein gp47/JayE
MTSIYDSTGLTVDRYADALARMIALAEAWKGSSLSTDEEELLGHLFRQEALVAAEANEVIQAIFDALGVSNNSGVPLDNMLELVGLERQAAARSTVTLTCTATKALTIPAGKLVKTDANVYFATDADLVFAGAGSDDVEATCTVDGPYDAGIGEVDTIVTPVSGWTVATNAAAAVPGRDRELDSALKARHTTHVSTAGENDAAGIYAAVSAVDGVSAVSVVEDYTSATPVSIYAIGGDDDEIAQAIDDNLTVGIGTAGTTNVDVYNAVTATTKTINFTRASNLPIYIEMTITATPGIFPATGDDDIKAALVELGAPLRIAQDLEYLQLPGAVYQTPGLTINSLYVGTAPSPVGTSDVVVAADERAVISAANVAINHA